MPDSELQPTRRPLAALALTVAVALAALGSAHAADKPKKEASFGGTKATGAYLTKAQLRSCLKAKDDTATRDAALARQKTELTTAHDEVGRSGEALKAKMDALDRSDAAAVDAWNAESSARDQRIDGLQARVAAFNAEVEAAKLERDAFVKDCGNRRYFEEDEAELRQGR